MLDGRTAIITGASQGFGLALARGFLEQGASVSICGRDASALEKSQAELRPHVKAGRTLVVEVADVASEKDMERYVDTTLSAFGGRVDVLVNNAGIYGPKGPLEECALSDWKRAVEINLFGSVIVSAIVVPVMKKQGYGKIIQISGGGATQPMPRFTAYAASKAAVVRFAESLAMELGEHGIDVNSVALGALNTRLLDEVLEAGPSKVGEAFYRRALEQREKGGAPMSRGVELCTFLASAESDGVTGKLISALWDQWEGFPEHRGELASSDVFTLRRIVGKDRSLPWADR